MRIRANSSTGYRLAGRDDDIKHFHPSQRLVSEQISRSVTPVSRHGIGERKLAVTGLILAGGQGRRMGGEDKGWLELGARPLIEIAIERLGKQVDHIIISANRNVERYRRLNNLVVEDALSGFQGPLAGFLSGLQSCRTDFMVAVPCDSPFFPTDLVVRMLEMQQITQADIISVSDGNRTHPVFALLKTELAGSLQSWLAGGGRKIDRWYDTHHYELLEYPDGESFFENINSPQQLKQAQLKKP